MISTYTHMQQVVKPIKLASLIQILQLTAEEYLSFVCNPEGSDIPTAVRNTTDKI